MTPDAFIEAMNKQESAYGILLTTYYGLFDKSKECSLDFITAQLHIPASGIVFNLTSGEREVVEKIIAVSELNRIPLSSLNDYVDLVLMELHEVIDKHRRKGVLKPDDKL